ncbi:MAG: protein translocase subunit SecDF [Flavobacteriales bacterium]|nr:protein translocase subunit SecDF [Flavobacteriales bacterium]MDG2246238.1 protein translocase subunit SecDF [Flavobacteriales bacterium]
MQNKSAVLLFTILLAIAALYTLSFNWVASNFEETAEKQAEFVADSIISSGAVGANKDRESLVKEKKREFLRDSANAEVYPVFGHTYQEVKENELNLGLDLRGGMSVTLEVSIPDLIKSLSDYSDNPDFVSAIEKALAAQANSNDDYVTLFGDAWADQNSSVELWRIFHNMESKDLFPAKSTDDEIIAILRSEAETAINNTENIIRKRIDQFGVAQPNVQKMAFSGRILVELPGVDDRERVRKQLKTTANLEFWETFNNDEIFSKVAAANNALGRALNPELFTPEMDSLAADSAGLTPEQQQLRSPLFKLLQPQLQTVSPVVGYALTKDTDDLDSLFNHPAVLAELGPNLRLMWESSPTTTVSALYAIRDDSGKGKAKLDGRNIVDSSVGYDEVGDVICNMTMDAEGTGSWGRMTEEAANDGNRIVCVVLDNKVVSAPSVRVPITNGRSQISFGSGQTVEEKLSEAEDLSSLLKAGSLPAPAKIVDEVSVGAQLGQSNINAGLYSFLIALFVILVYMIFYYKGAGLVADIALIANLFFLIGALASLKAALTLPGIAGIVLTIGMAVDANVLIFERVREEMRNGKSLGVAVKEGYGKAYSAIIDANITTLLTAIVLFAFGSGPIRGFATTLIIGIFTSLFSAIVLTRLIFFSRLENKKSISFTSNITKNWFTNSKIDFVGKRKTFYIVSGLIVVAGIASLSMNGLNKGIDFTGGTTADVTFASPVDVDAVRGYCEEAFTEENGAKANPIVQTKDSNASIRIKTNYLIGSNADDVDEQITSAIESAMEKTGVEFTIDRYNKVDDTISDDFQRGAMYATIFSLIVIFLYLVFRFRKWQFGIGALVAMVHDVLIVIALFSLLWKVMPFTMEIDQAFIAAILTVIGYSINDTVVVFDRIREYLGLYGSKREEKDIINDALNSTLGRTINTSLSTFVVLLTIFVLGGDNIKGFVFALMVGVVVGTYSSIFIATPSVIDLSKRLTPEKK